MDDGDIVLRQMDSCGIEVSTFSLCERSQAQQHTYRVVQIINDGIRNFVPEMVKLLAGRAHLEHPRTLRRVRRTHGSSALAGTPDTLEGDRMSMFRSTFSHLVENTRLDGRDRLISWSRFLRHVVAQNFTKVCLPCDRRTWTLRDWNVQDIVF